MGNRMKKCKSPGCGKWVVHNNDLGYCPDHQKKADPLSMLYVARTPEQVRADERAIEFFSYLLNHRSLEELLSI